MGKFIKDPRRWLGDRSLPAASLMAGAGLLLVAAVVLWLTGLPQGGYGWHVEPMLWKDRLTYAAGVAAGLGALVALVVSYRKQRDAEEGKFAAQFAAAAAQLGDDAPARSARQSPPSARVSARSVMILPGS
jgi:hypothetical protein